MSRKEQFVHKLLKRLDRLDQKAVGEYVQSITQDQAFLSRILHLIGVGIIILNEDDSIYFINAKAADWLGISAAQLKTGSRFFDKIPDTEFQSWLRKRMNEASDGSSDFFHVLIPKEKYLQATFHKLPFEDRQKTVLFLNLQAPAVNDERYSHMASLVKLAGGIAHEIGNPLNSIIIHLNLLVKQLDKMPSEIQKNLKKSLDAILSEASRLDTIIRTFLKATRNPPLRYKIENLNDLIEETTDFLKPEMAQRQIRLEFERDTKLPLCLVDNEKLKQAFINVIKNAMEAMPSGGLLKIRLYHQGKVVWIEFKDEGQGIEDADLPFIFDAYFTTKESGSGLGLMTVYNIIREHGGRIQVTSRKNKGTTLTLVLPIRQPKLQLPEPKGD